MAPQSSPSPSKLEDLRYDSINITVLPSCRVIPHLHCRQCHISTLKHHNLDAFHPMQFII